MRWRSTDRRAWDSLRARLTLWNTAVVLLMTVASLLAVRFGARAAIYRETDAVLRGSVREVALAITDLYPDLEAVIDVLKRKEAGHAERAWFMHLLTEDGTTLWKSGLCPEAVASFPPTRTDRRENFVQVGPYRYVRLAIDSPGHRPFHVRMGMSTAALDEHVAALMRLLLSVGVVLSLLTPLAGYWLAVRATRPVAGILATAERLRPTRLGDRLAVRGTGDELDRLSTTINGLLDQVADHVERQDRFVADAAHELRGPLAAMQSALEVALSQDRPTAAYRDTITDVLEAARHLSRLANDLLLLAEGSETAAACGPEPADLAAVAAQGLAMFAGVAEERGVELAFETPGPLLVAGDSGRLRQVVGNLLDNALRFTPRGGRIDVRVSEDGAGGAILAVADTGSGIAAAELERIFDRFWRGDPARSRGGDRSGGLGLAICKAIVEGCGGSIKATSRPGAGTTISVRLPALPSLRGVPAAIPG